MKPVLLSCLLALGGAPLAAAQTPGPVAERRTMTRPPSPVVIGERAEVPITLARGMPTVQVTIDGKGPFRFGVETGANGHGRITPKVAEALGLTIVGQARARGGNPDAVQRRPVYGLPSLKIGGLEFRDLSMSVFDPPPPPTPPLDGLLGLNLFAKLMLVIDYPGLTLTLDRSVLADGPGVASYPEDSLITLPLRVGAETLPVQLDTGNMVAPLILSEADARRLARPGEPRARGVGRSGGVSVSMFEVDLTQPVALGGRALPVTTAAFPALRDVGNLGSLALSTSVVRVDQRNRRVEIRPEGAQPRASGGDTAPPVRTPATPLRGSASEGLCRASDVTAAERRWLDAYETRNADVMADTLLDGFIITFPNGSQQRKTDLVSQIRRQAARGGPAPQFSTAGTITHDFGGVVVLTGRVNAGRAGDPPQQYTDTWLCDGGRWRVAASHLTDIKP